MREWNKSDEPAMTSPQRKLGEGLASGITTCYGATQKIQVDEIVGGHEVITRRANHQT
jgi:hypothetical protein